jgi:hypothetical protein
LPQQVPAFISRGTMHHTDVRDLYQQRRELPPNFASGSEFTRIPLGFFTCRKAGKYYFTSYPKEGILRIFRMNEKSNPRTRVPVASMLTTWPPKPSTREVSNCAKQNVNSWSLRRHIHKQTAKGNYWPCHVQPSTWKRAIPTLKIFITFQICDSY